MLCFPCFFHTGECEYVECVPGEWSEFSPQCGKNITRSRPINVLHKTVTRNTCVGLQTSCPLNVETEAKDEICKFILFQIVFAYFMWFLT